MSIAGQAMRCPIVDDSAAFIEAARRLLEQGGVSVIATASTSADALRLFRKLQPDLTLVDVHLGAEDGFDLIEELHQCALPTPRSLVLMSTHAEQDLVDLIATSSATGFVPMFALTPDAIRRLIDQK